MGLGPVLEQCAQEAYILTRENARLERIEKQAAAVVKAYNNCDGSVLIEVADGHEDVELLFDGIEQLGNLRAESGEVRTEGPADALIKELATPRPELEAAGLLKTIRTGQMYADEAFSAAGEAMTPEGFTETVESIRSKFGEPASGHISERKGYETFKTWAERICIAGGGLPPTDMAAIVEDALRSSYNTGRRFGFHDQKTIGVALRQASDAVDEQLSGIKISKTWGEDSALFDEFQYKSFTGKLHANDEELISAIANEMAKGKRHFDPETDRRLLTVGDVMRCFRERGVVRQQMPPQKPIETKWKGEDPLADIRADVLGVDPAEAKKRLAKQLGLDRFDTIIRRAHDRYVRVMDSTDSDEHGERLGAAVTLATEVHRLLEGTARPEPASGLVMSHSLREHLEAQQLPGWALVDIEFRGDGKTPKALHLARVPDQWNEEKLEDLKTVVVFRIMGKAPVNDVSYEGWASSIVASIRGENLDDHSISAVWKGRVQRWLERAHDQGRQGWPHAGDTRAPWNEPCTATVSFGSVEHDTYDCRRELDHSGDHHHVTEGGVVLTWKPNASVDDEDSSVGELGPNGECPHCGSTENCNCHEDVGL